MRAGSPATATTACAVLLLALVAAPTSAAPVPVAVPVPGAAPAATGAPPVEPSSARRPRVAFADAPTGLQRLTVRHAAAQLTGDGPVPLEGVGELSAGAASSTAVRAEAPQPYRAAYVVSAGDSTRVVAVPALGGGAASPVTCGDDDVESAVAVAPSGRRVAYVSSAGGRDSLWLATLAVPTGPAVLQPGVRTCPSGRGDGALWTSRQLTSGPGEDRWPAWTPDGERLVLSSTRDDPRGDLYVVDAVAGAPLVRLTDDPGADGEPVVVPGVPAPLVVFRTSRFRADGSLGVLALGTGPTPVTSLFPAAPLQSGEPAWHEDDVLAFTSTARDPAGDVWAAELDRTGSTPVLRGAAPVAARPGTVESHAAWSGPSRPAGEGAREAALVVTSRVAAAQVEDVTAGEGAARRALAPLLEPDRDARDPSYSPDGLRQVHVRGPTDGGGHRLVVTAADGTDATPLPAGRQPDDHDLEPAWSPDGSQVAFVRVRAGRAALWVVALADGAARQVRVVDADAYDDASPSWSPDGSRLVLARRRLQPPAAQLVATPPQGYAPLAVDLDGRGSSDPEGLALTATIDPGDGSGPVPGDRLAHTYAAAGTYTATLTVTSSEGLTDTDTAVVTVRPVLPPDAVLQVAPREVRTGEPVTADGSASTDPQGLPLRYRFDWGDGTSTDAGAEPTATHVYAEPGDHTVTLTVTASSGLSDTDSATVQVTRPVLPPTARLTVTPDEPRTGQTVTADGSASTDPQGQPLTYTFAWGDGATSGPQAEPAATHAYDAPGTYTVTLTVRNTSGLTSTADQDVRVVRRLPPPRAVLDLSAPSDDSSAPPEPAPRDELVVAPGEPVQADGSRSRDPEDRPLQYAFRWGDGSPDRPFSTDPRASHVYEEPGSYRVTLTVRTSDGRTDTDAQTVRVSRQPPRAVLTVDPTDPLFDEPVTADGSDSTDPVGRGLTYTFDWGDGSPPTSGGPTQTHRYGLSARGTRPVVTLTVTDADGVSDTASQELVVRCGQYREPTGETPDPAPDPPADGSCVPPDATLVVEPTSGAAPLVVEADGSASTDPHGLEPLEHRIDPGDGSPPVEGPRTVHEYERPGTYDVVLTVTNTVGMSATDTVRVVVEPGPLAPTARLEVRPDLVRPGDPVTADGSDSSDPNTPPLALTYSFDFGDGAPPTAPGPSPTAEHSYREEGSAVVTLTVRNTAGLSDTATATVTVSPDAPPPDPGPLFLTGGPGPRAAPSAVGAGSAARRLPELWTLDVGSGKGAALRTPCASEPCPQVLGRTPAWSPDGTRIAHDAAGSLALLTLVPGPGPERVRDVGVVAGPGAPRDADPLLQAVTEPTWSPDGSELAVSAQPAGRPDDAGVYALRPDGSGLRPLAQRPGAETGPSWQPSTDLAVGLTAAPVQVLLGGSTILTAGVRNDGPLPALDATLHLTLPAALVPAALPAGCSPAAGALACLLGDLAVGEEVDVPLELAGGATGAHVVRADVVTRTPDRRGDDDTASSLVVVSLPRPSTDVAVRVVTETPGYVGGSVPARVQVRNQGREPARDVVLRVALPPGVVQGGPAGCPVTCALGTLAPGQERTYEVDLELAAASAGDRVLLARVATSTPDADRGNDVARAGLRVEQPSLRLLPETVEPGQVTLAYAEHLPPGAQVTFTWTSGITAHAGPFTVEADGTVRQPVLVLRRDTLGARQIVLAGEPGRFGEVEAAVLVVPRSLAPPRFLGRG